MEKPLERIAQGMVTIEEIIGARDLERLFRSAVGRGKAAPGDKNAVVKRIREFAPLVLRDLEGFLDDCDILRELQDYERKSVLGEIRNSISR
jgi:hypothetical protein